MDQIPSNDDLSKYAISGTEGADLSKYAIPNLAEADLSKYSVTDLDSKRIATDIQKQEVQARVKEPFLSATGKLENLHEPTRKVDPKEELQSFLVDVDGKSKMLAPAAASFKALQEYAGQEGLTLTLNNAYRGVDEQARLVREGYPAAQPGYSAHQTGLAADFNLPWGAGTKEEKRMVELSNRFGWYQTYPERADEFHHFVYGPDKETAFEVERKATSGQMPDAATFTKPKAGQLSQKEAIANNIAEEFGLDSKYFKEQIAAESGWRSDAVSPVGAKGMLQIMPETLLEVIGQMKSRGLIPDTYTVDTYNKDMIFQLRAGAFYQQQMKAKTNSHPEALAAYNAGLGGLNDMKKSGRVYEETGNYVAKIMGVDRAVADKWILEGGGPKGNAIKKEGSPYVNSANPYESNLQVLSGNSEIVSAYKKYGKLDDHVKAMSMLIPTYGDDFIDSIMDPTGTFIRGGKSTTREQAKEELKKEVKEFNASAYWQGWAKRAVNEMTAGLTSGFDLFGIGALDKDELDALDSVELDENSNAVSRLFTQVGPELVGGIAGLLVGGALVKGGMKAFQVARGVGAVGATEAVAGSLVAKGTTSPGLISSSVGKWLTLSAERSALGNMATATGSGILLSVPAAMASYTNSYNEAELRGASDVEAAAAAQAAFTGTMFMGSIVAFAAPAASAAGAMGLVGLSKAAPAISGGLSTIGRYASDATPQMIKNMAGSVSNSYQNSWLQGAVTRSSKMGWDAMSAAQKAPIVGGFINAVKALPQEVQKGFVLHSQMYRDHLAAFGKRSEVIDGLAAGEKAADIIGFGLDAHGKTINSFRTDVTKVKTEAAALKKQVQDQQADLLRRSGADSLTQDYAGLSLGAQDLIGGGGASSSSKGAQKLFEARETLKEHLNPFGGANRLDALERAMVSASKEGLSQTDASNIIMAQRDLYTMGRKKELIDDAGLQVALKKLDAMEKVVPPSAGGKTSEGIKQFVKENTTEARRFFDTYNEANTFAQKLGDTTSDTFLTHADAQLNKINAWEASTQGKAVQAMKNLLGSIDEVEHRIAGTLDPRQLSSNYQIIEKHLDDVTSSLAGQQEALKSFKEMSVKQQAKVASMPDDEVMALPKASLNLGDALVSPTAAADLERALSEGQRIKKSLTPTAADLEIEQAFSKVLSTKADGMQWDPGERFKDIAGGLNRLQGKEAFQELTSDYKAVSAALKNAGFETTAIDTSGSLIQSIADTVKKLTTEATELSKVRSLGTIQDDIANAAGMSSTAYQMSKKANVDEIQGMVSGLLSNKSLQTAFNEKTAISTQMSLLDDDFGKLVANAQSPEDIAKLLADINTAAAASKVDEMLAPLGAISDRAATESSSLQKSLARMGSDEVVHKEVIISAINSSEAGATTGAYLAGQYAGQFEKSLPATLKAVEARMKTTPELKDFENFSSRLDFHLTSALHDTFTGRQPNAIDKLINQGFSDSGPLPELAEALYPVKMLAKTISESRAGTELKGLSGFFNTNYSPRYSRLEALRKYSQISSDSPFYLYEGMLQSTNAEKRMSMAAVRAKAMEAESALSSAYAEKLGKKMPANHWESVVLSPHSNDPNFLRGAFSHSGQVSPLTDKEVLDLAKALPYRYLSTKPSDLIGGFVKTAISSDSGRRMLGTLATLEAPGSGVPYIIDITDAKYKGQTPTGLATGVGRGAKATAPTINVPSEYKKLTLTGGTPMDIKGLSIKGHYVAAENIRVHPDLYETFQRSYLNKEAKETFLTETMNFVKHSVLLGSPQHFLNTGMGQMMKISNFSLGKALGGTHLGSTLETHGTETFQRALASGLNLNSVIMNVKGIGDYTLKRTPLAQLERDTINNPLTSMQRKPTLGEKVRATGRHLSEGFGELDTVVNNPLVFDSLRKAQLGAWSYKVSELWEAKGRDLMKSGLSYKEALHEVEKVASSVINKGMMTMHKTWMSDDLRAGWFNYNLAPGITQARLATVVDGFMATREAVARKLFPNSAKALGKDSMFAYGIVNPEMQAVYRQDAMKMFTYGLASSYVFANAMSYLLNGHSTFKNAPGKEDQVRIGMNYYKPTVFGFDSMFNRLVRSTPGIKDAIDYGRSEILGDPRQADSLGTAFARTVSSMAHPALGITADLAANKTLSNGLPIVAKGNSFAENVSSVAGYATSEYAPWLELATIPANVLAGNGPVKYDMATGGNMGFPSTVGELAGAYVSHSPPASEFSRDIKKMKSDMTTQLRNDVKVGLVSVATMPDGEARAKLLKETLEKADTGYPIRNKKLAEILGTDRFTLSERQKQNLIKEVFHEEAFSVESASAEVRETAKSRSDELLQNNRGAFGDILQGNLGGRI